MTEAYACLRREMEQQAQTLMSQPHASINEVIAVLDSKHVVQTSAQVDYPSTSYPPLFRTKDRHPQQLFKIE